MYFFKDPMYGTSTVMDGYFLSWVDIDGESYHHITKTKGENYYKYFITSFCEIPKDYSPGVFAKLVFMEDANKFGMGVSSMFSKIQQDQRNR